MATLFPCPFGALVTRMFHELDARQQIFDLPASAFVLGDPALDCTATFSRTYGRVAIWTSRRAAHPARAEPRPPSARPWRREPETFNFLGFTHMCSKTRKGRYTVLRQTMRQRWQAKLREVKAELRRRLHTPIPVQGAYLRSVAVGHTRYYGVPRNGPSISAFHQALGRVWRVTLMRRSQNGFVSWARMRRLMARWVPRPRICHPYPNQRLPFVTQGRSRMR